VDASQSGVKWPILISQFSKFLTVATGSPGENLPVRDIPKLNLTKPFLSACFLVAAGIAHAFFGIRYSVTAGGAAIMAVLQAHLFTPTTGFSIVERFLDTVAGALLGWAATYLLPTWQRASLPKVLQRAIDALRADAAEVTRLRDDTTVSPRLARQRAYDAIQALSAIRSLSLAEPADVRVPVPQLTSWLSAAYGVMSSLSNLRLFLVLHAPDHDAQALRAAMTAASRAIDTALCISSTVPQAPPALGCENENAALAAIPTLASRVHRAIDDASAVSVLSAQIEALIRLSPGHAGEIARRVDQGVTIVGERESVKK
jgi:uncharacterized membrane protein YccC